MPRKSLSALCLMLAVLSCFLLPAGCAKEESVPEVTYSDIVEANRSSVLLKSHTSVKAITAANGDSPSYIYYVDPDTLAADFVDYQLVYTPDIQGTFAKGTFNPVLNLSGEDFYQEQHDYFLLEPSEDQLVTDRVRNGDTLTVTTELSAEISQSAVEAMVGAAEENDHLAYEYSVNANDYSLLSYSVYLCREGEERLRLEAIEEIIYDEEAPAFIAEVLELAAAPQELAEDEMRTISVILDPGTSDEETFAVKVAKGTGIDIIHPDGYSTLYIDSECTVPYSEGIVDKSEDLTLYGCPDK